jgi:GNAT superfamily N-acetyltransferase
MRVVGEPLHYGLRDARFAYTRLAGDQHYTAVTILRLLPAAHEYFDFLAPAHQRRGDGAQCLEAALD